MENRKQVMAIAVVLFIITALGIGFAAFSNIITIGGSASVNPNSNTFKVVFTKTSGTEDTSAIVPTLSPTTITATNGIIVNGTASTISNLNVSFTEPGQSATYTFYVYNKGSYLAHLKTITYNGSKSCTAGTGTTQSLATSACDSISLQVKVGNTTTTSTTSNITGNTLSPGESKQVTVTINYASNGTSADGPFTVSFPDVSLYYSTAADTN